MRQRGMHANINAHFGLLDRMMVSARVNEFLERLEQIMDWGLIETALQAMYLATTGRPDTSQELE